MCNEGPLDLGTFEFRQPKLCNEILQYWGFWNGGPCAIGGHTGLEGHYEYDAQVARYVHVDKLGNRIIYIPQNHV